MAEIGRNLRFAARLLWRRPAFTIASLAILTLGIALNTVAFGIVNALLFRPLPFPDDDRMVVLYEQNTKSFTRAFTSLATFHDWRAQSRSFESMAAALERSSNIDFTESGDGVPESMPGAMISAGALEFMGFKPVAGRGFTAGDETGTARVVMLGEKLWRERLGADPAVIGRTLTVNGERATLVGVLPRRFQILYGGYEVVEPLREARTSTDRAERGLQVVARMRRGISTTQAQAELQVFTARIAADYPASSRDWEARVVNYRGFLFATARKMYPLLLTASALVLLIVCANISNLYLAQAIGRRKEIAVRAALGARRSQIVRQMLAEGWLLAVAGGVIAFLLVVWTRYILIANYPELSALQADMRVFAYTLLVSCVAGTVFGLTPALAASKPDINEVLKSGAAGGVSRRTLRLRRLLIISELAVSLTLLTAAGLLVRSTLELRSANPGFSTARLLTAQLTLRGSRYSEHSAQAAFARVLQERLAGMPGVEGATVMSSFPLLGAGRPLRLEASAEPGSSRQVYQRQVDFQYHSLMGIHTVAGRSFSAGDREGTEPVVILSESLARDIAPENAGGVLGSRVRVSGGPWRRIIGVSADVRQVLTQPASPEILVPLAQEPADSLWIAVRGRSDPRALAGMLRKEVSGMDPSLPLGSIQTMEDIVAIYFPGVMLVGLMIFSIVAMSVAAMGLYGVMASMVAERTREIGIRMALGAESWMVLRYVICQSLRTTAWGGAIGLLGALGLARVIAGALYGINPADPLVFGSVSMVLMMVTIAAAYFPARRASRLNPVVALHHE